jgi:hypothetical protein
LFDEDFCSRDHRQRYHERVRKALDHLPKGQAAPRPSAVAGFQFEKPRVQTPVMQVTRAAESYKETTAPAIPEFAHTASTASLDAAPFTASAPQPAVAAEEQQKHDAEATFAPASIMSIDNLRSRLHRAQSSAAAPVLASPVAIAPLMGNMALKVSHRALTEPQVFDELNHVYLHVPDPVLMTRLPLGNAAQQIEPAAANYSHRHIAAAGPSGAGRIEFFPVQEVGAAGMPVVDAENSIPEMAGHSAENIWLEDPMSWQIPVISLASTRSALAVMPMADRASVLQQFRQAERAAAVSAPVMEWQFEATGLARESAKKTNGLVVAPAMVIEFPAASDRAAQPYAESAAMLVLDNFELTLPAGPAITEDLLMPATEPADVAPLQSDAFGPQTKIGETLLPRTSGWFPIGANKVAKQAAFESNGVGLNMPARAVRLNHGPDFCITSLEIANSAARPVASDALGFAGTVYAPEIPVSALDVKLRPAASQPLVPARAPETATNREAEAIIDLSIEIPAIDASPAGFREQALRKIEMRVFDCGDRSLHQFGWMEPKLTLQLPTMQYEEYPLALKVSVPEPRTVTVFETATLDEQGKVLNIADAKTSKRFMVPSYLKGMAAGLMLASFLWFGSSSIKSDGMTLRPGDLIRLTIQRRAVYETGDNFHAGLASWDGKFAKTWLYDKEGFVRPGRLALFKPSHDMSDYKLEFLTQVERKSVGWVFRAEDEQNYYAMKLAVTEPGPRPLVALVRYQVIDGKKESRGETPLQVMMHNNRPYRVQVDVKGNQFQTSIEGQLVDSWSDNRLKSGGVGFFTDSSEKARLYWMKITKNSDFLGKLCAVLVPKES